MSFADPNVNDVGLSRSFGTVARFEQVDTAATTALTNQAVWTCNRTGFYAIFGSLTVNVVGTGAGQTWDMDLIVNNGAAQTTLGTNFVAAVDALTQYAIKSSTVQYYYLRVNDTVKISTNSNGTETTKPQLSIACVVVAL